MYVDNESVTVAHSELLLQGNDQAAVIQALDQPVGLLMLALLDFVPESWDPPGILARYRDRLAPGSYLALSHGAADGDPAGWTEVVELYQNTPEPVYPRNREGVLRLFAGFELVDPGLVGCALWRPSGAGDISDSAEMNMIVYGGVGRKP